MNICFVPTPWNTHGKMGTFSIALTIVLIADSRPSFISLQPPLKSEIKLDCKWFLKKRQVIGL